MENNDKKVKLELKNPTIHQKNDNCQVFNGPISGCVFAMPGSNVTQQSERPKEDNTEDNQLPQQDNIAYNNEIDEQLSYFIHTSVDSQQEWQIHEEIKRLVSRQGIQEICKYLTSLAANNKVLLPQNAEKAYRELIRMGMPDGEGYSFKTFTKYYKR